MGGEEAARPGNGPADYSQDFWTPVSRLPSGEGLCPCRMSSQTRRSEVQTLRGSSYYFWRLISKFQKDSGLISAYGLFFLPITE